MNVAHVRRNALIAVSAVVLVASAGALHRAVLASDGEPWTPSDPAEVVFEASEADVEDARAAREGLPADPAVLADGARAAILRARRTGDPRHLGSAQAALARWSAAVDPAPAELLILRATVLQSLHDFEGALKDLTAAAALEPENPQLWLTRAMIELATARYDEAGVSCGRLWGWPQVACGALLKSLTGQAEKGLEELHVALRRQTPATAAERAWALSVVGEVAVRAGKDAAALKAYEAALALDPDDAYTRAAYADLLLELGRPEEARALVEAHGGHDALLLRKAIAEARLGNRGDAQDELAARIAANRLRGDTLHGREEARFTLELENDPGRALSAALKNWEHQREPADAQLVLASALAAGRAEEAAPVIALMQRAGWEQPRLRGLAASLRGVGR